MRSNDVGTPSAWNVKVQGHGINKYPAKAHALRVAEAAGSPSGLIILEGERKVNYSGSDQPRHFRQDRYFYYITGCNEPDCYVTYDTAKDYLTLWLPQADPRRVFYDGRGSTPEEAMEKYDIDDAKYICNSLSVAWFARDFQLHIMLPRESGSIINQTAFCSDGRNVQDTQVLRRAMNDCRAIKDADEIALIRKANKVSSKAHREVLKQLPRLRREAEAEGLFLNTCISEGAKEQAYGPIMGSGPNAGILHYQANNETFDDRQVLLIDASCEWELYAADITRTMPLNRKHPGYWPSKEAEAIYKVVESVQESCIRMMTPGTYYIDINWHAIHMSIDALLYLGILKGDHMEIFHAGTVSAFFPHGLGHHLGLEVHDVTPMPSTRTASTADDSSSTRTGSQQAEDIATAYERFTNDSRPHHKALPGFSKPENFSLMPSASQRPCTIDSKALEPGNVVTVEPGIYFNKFILDTVYLPDPKHSKFIDEKVLERYMPVGGVRIEDDILVTEKGYENLTGAVKGEGMLKAIRGEV